MTAAGRTRVVARLALTLSLAAIGTLVFMLLLTIAWRLLSAVTQSAVVRGLFVGVALVWFALRVRAVCHRSAHPDARGLGGLATATAALAGVTMVVTWRELLLATDPVSGLTWLFAALSSGAAVGLAVMAVRARSAEPDVPPPADPGDAARVAVAVDAGLLPLVAVAVGIGAAILAGVAPTAIHTWTTTAASVGAFAALLAHRDAWRDARAAVASWLVHLVGEPWLGDQWIALPVIAVVAWVARGGGLRLAIATGGRVALAEAIARVVGAVVGGMVFGAVGADAGGEVAERAATLLGVPRARGDADGGAPAPEGATPRRAVSHARR